MTTYFDLLPVELVLQIASYLTADELVEFEKSSAAIRTNANDGSTTNLVQLVFDEMRHFEYQYINYDQMAPLLESVTLAIKTLYRCGPALRTFKFSDIDGTFDGSSFFFCCYGLTSVHIPVLNHTYDYMDFHDQFPNIERLFFRWNVPKAEEIGMFNTYLKQKEGTTNLKSVTVLINNDTKDEDIRLVMNKAPNVEELRVVFGYRSAERMDIADLILARKRTKELHKVRRLKFFNDRRHSSLLNTNVVCQIIKAFSSKLTELELDLRNQSGLMVMSFLNERIAHLNKDCKVSALVACTTKTGAINNHDEILANIPQAKLVHHECDCWIPEPTTEECSFGI